MQDPGETEAQRLQRQLEGKYPRLSTDRGVVISQAALNDNEPDVVGKKYVYEGKPGKIRVDGVEVDVDSLSDSEKVTAGEQFLKHYSQTTGIPVSELRSQLSDLSTKATQKAMVQGIAKANVKPQPRLVAMGGGKQMVVNQAGNRRERRKEAALKRRK